jgi:CRISPR-associated exonuclease Cas4
MSYQEEEYLLISGIQHFCFCRRQWALIHVEQQWQENLKTTEGNIIHEKCHDDAFEEKRNDLIVARGLRVASHEMGVTGQCDVVEFTQGETGAYLADRKGFWKPYPIEYKRGHSKSIDADRLQLCCEAMCLEEMLGVSILEGALFYAETHRRENVIFDELLRDKVKKMLLEMHHCFSRGYTPKMKPRAGCNSCSLRETCLPQLCGNKSVKKYYQEIISEEKL